MKQQDLDLNLSKRHTRKMELLALMDSVVPWPELAAKLHAVAPVKASGRPPFAHETMLRLHLLQQLFGLGDFAMEETLFETLLYRDFAGLDANARLPDRVSILRFRHLLEKHQLAQQFFDTVNAMLKARGLMLHSGTVIDATIIAAPSSTKNSSGKRDPEMHQTKKGNQWHHGMKGHAGVNADSGQKREEIQAKYPNVNWHIAMMPGKRKALDKSSPMGGNPGETGEDQGQHPYQGRTSVSCDQAPVRLHQGALPWAGQEHGSAVHAVHAVQPLDGEKALPTGLGGISASATGQKAEVASQNSAKSMPRAWNSSRSTPPFPSCGIQAIKIASAMSFAHHP